MCQRLSCFPYSLDPHRPRAATGLRCGSDALERNCWPRPSDTLSLAACSSFLEREESPISRSLGGIQLSFLVQRHNRIEDTIRTYVCNVRAHTRVAGWGGV